MTAVKAKPKGRGAPSGPDPRPRPRGPFRPGVWGPALPLARPREAREKTRRDRLFS
jgi:hypothetical protein